MKKIINKIILCVCVILLFSSSQGAIHAAIKDDFINLDPKEIEYVNYSGSNLTNLKSLIDKINSYKESKNIEVMYEIIDSLEHLHSNMDNSDISRHKSNDQLDYIYYTIIDQMLELKSEDANKVMIYLADSFYKTTAVRVKSGNINSAIFEGPVAWTFINSYNPKNGLIKNTFPAKTVEIFKVAYINCYSLLNNKNIKPDDIDINYKPSFSVTDDMTSSDLAIGKEDDVVQDEVDWDIIQDQEYLETINDKINSYMSNNYELEYFDEIEGDCYRTIVKNKNGIMYKSTTKALNSEYRYCGIYDYYDSYYNEFFYDEYSPSALREKYSTNNKLSEYTLNYTIEKDKGENAKYHSTNLRVYEDLSSNYSYLKNVYEVIGKKTKSEVLKDEDVILIILNGKPYYICERDVNYKKDEIENMFDGDENVGIKIGKVKWGKVTIDEVDIDQVQ
ncbi:hypothetical protein [Clostridium sp.]|uniref:hypothetical protein n=1 Tax=Clostridium sp. TaxID=1506 RepID=UPI001B5F0AAD|nr:hypothetical protein [Clostridium sp.]MBP3915614.1 hypothetical protein [Clostridium sp.]